MRTDQHGLVIEVADHADPFVTFHIQHIKLEFGPELGILDVVDKPGKPVLIQNGHTTPLGTEVGVIIRSVEELGDTIFLGDDTKQTTHSVLLDEPILAADGCSLSG